MDAFDFFIFDKQTISIFIIFLNEKNVQKRKFGTVIVLELTED